MKIVKDSGKYNVKATGEQVSYEYEYAVYDNLEDAIADLGEAEALKCIQRMVKVDANNITREKTKSANGHSTRKVLTEEEKASRKAARQADKALLAVLKEKGLSLDDLANL